MLFVVLTGFAPNLRNLWMTFLQIVIRVTLTQEAKLEPQSRQEREGSHELYRFAPAMLKNLASLASLRLNFPSLPAVWRAYLTAGGLTRQDQ